MADSGQAGKRRCAVTMLGGFGPGDAVVALVQAGSGRWRSERAIFRRYVMGDGHRAEVVLHNDHRVFAVADLFPSRAAARMAVHARNAKAEPCGFRLFGMMPPCVLPIGHTGDHTDGFGGFYGRNVVAQPESAGAACV